MKRLLKVSLLFVTWFACSQAWARPKDINLPIETALENPSTQAPRESRTVLFFDDLESGAAGWESFDFTAFDSADVSWHVSAQGAFEGTSWWCGDEQIGGYNNSWLQYLDTPTMDLSRTTDPMLTFKAMWSMEAPSVFGSWDGWDVANMWVSTDDGATWNVVRPTTGSTYNVASAYGFGHTFNFGPNIPGWGGGSGGWQDIGVNLSSYKTTKTKVRFALCSDNSVSAPDSSYLVGFHVDNINVKDGAIVIFSNNGVEDGNLKADSDGFEGYGDLWDLSTRRASSPTHSLYCGDPTTGKYLPNLDDMLVSPPIDLTGLAANPEVLNVDFNVWCRQDSIGASLALRDYWVPYVFIEAESKIEALTGFAYTGRWVAADGGFLRFSLAQARGAPSLAKWQGKVIRIAFNYISNDDGDEREGLYIDNLTVNYVNVFAPCNVNAVANYDLKNVKLTWDTSCHPARTDNPDGARTTEFVENQIYMGIDALPGEEPIATLTDPNVHEFIDANVSGLFGQPISFMLYYKMNTVYKVDGVVFITEDSKIDTVKVVSPAIEDDDQTRSAEFRVLQNRPNPLTQLSTTIGYTLPQAGPVLVNIYNTGGQLVKTLVNQTQDAGDHAVAWNGSNDTGKAVTSGVYFYTVSAAGQQATRRMVVLK